jgi:hypothetical protein
VWKKVNNENHLNIDNIQILCAACNRTKGDKTMSEFVKYCSMIVKTKEKYLCV